MNRHQPRRLDTRLGCFTLRFQIDILGQVVVTDSGRSAKQSCQQDIAP